MLALARARRRCSNMPASAAASRRAKQPDISLRLIQLAREGKRVLRLKGGDPFIFGRGGEEALALVAARVPFRFVPGISAGIGGLAYAGIPLTHRDINSAVTFVTGHDASGQVPDSVDWAALARGSPVIVVYMALKHLARIARLLQEGGRRRPRAGRDRQPGDLARAARGRDHAGACVADAEASGLEPPALLVVGEVVRLRAGLDWLGALAGRRSTADPLARGRQSRTGRAACSMAGIRGLIIAAPASGSGKTVVTLGLLRALAGAASAVASLQGRARLHRSRPFMPPPAAGPASISIPGRCGRRQHPAPASRAPPARDSSSAKASWACSTARPTAPARPPISRR